MKPSSFESRHLDIEAFAKAAAHLEGRVALPAFLRVVECAADEARPGDQDEVAWTAVGERAVVSGEAPQTWLHLQATARMALTCQRCLQPVFTALEVDRRFRFVKDEAAAQQLDAQSDEDVLVTSRSLDLLELLEDELLLSLPLVPTHAVCPQPLIAPADELPPTTERENPFAALAGLKLRGHLN